MKKGYFITFEGTEGSGKSTQIRRAALYLKRKGHDVVLFREPGSARISEAIRAVILNKKFKEMAPETELLLYLAARAQIVREKILPALKKGKVVICDRFEDSTLAYQGYGRGMSVAAIREVSKLFVRGNLRPDLVFLLNIDPASGMKRGGRHDRMERQSLAFHQKVYQGFLDLASKEPKRYRVINARKSIETVAAEVRSALERVL